MDMKDWDDLKTLLGSSEVDYRRCGSRRPRSRILLRGSWRSGRVGVVVPAPHRSSLG